MSNFQSSHRLAMAVLVAYGSTNANCFSQFSVTRPSTTIAQRDPTAAHKAVSYEEAKAFAFKLTESFRSEDSRAFAACIDWQHMAESAVNGLGLPTKYQRELVLHFSRMMHGEGGLLNTIRQRGGEDVSYELVNVRDEGGHKHVVFRVASTNGTNYHDFTLANTHGSIVAKQLYVFAAGETITDLIRRSMLPIANIKAKGDLHNLTSAESEYLLHFATIQHMRELLLASDSTKVLEIYQSLPRALKRDQATLLLRYQAAMRIGGTALLEAAEDFCKYHPNPSSLDLVMFDIHLKRKEYDRALACVDRVDRSIGGDKYLDLYRADVLFQRGETSDAIAKVESAIASMPGVFACYARLASYAIELEDHNLTVEVLSRMEEELGVEVGDIHALPGYASFVKSPQGKKWLARHMH